MNQGKYLLYAFLIVGLIGFVVVVNLFTGQNDSHPLSPEITVNTPPKNYSLYNDEGKQIFQSRCANCHAIDKKRVTGPAMAGVEKRGPWQDRKKLFSFMRNVGVTIRQYAYTKKLVQQYGGQIMPSYPLLSDKELTALFDYLLKASIAAR